MVAAVVIVSLFVLTHLDEAPVTGRTRLLVFSRENYIDLAAITSEMVRNENGGDKHTDVCDCSNKSVPLRQDYFETAEVAFYTLILESEVVPFPSTSVLAGV